MDIRKVTDTYFVSPQISPDDIAQIKAHGITTILCNRPDTEVPPSHQAAAVRAAAEAAGLSFFELPLTHQTFTPDNLMAQKSVWQSAEGACLAYCASGTRSTIAWALGLAGEHGADDIIAAAAAAGYDLRNMRGALEAAHQQPDEE